MRNFLMRKILNRKVLTSGPDSPSQAQRTKLFTMWLSQVRIDLKLRELLGLSNNMTLLVAMTNLSVMVDKTEPFMMSLPSSEAASGSELCCRWRHCSRGGERRSRIGSTAIGSGSLDGDECCFSIVVDIVGNLSWKKHPRMNSLKPRPNHLKQAVTDRCWVTFQVY